VSKISNRKLLVITIAIVLIILGFGYYKLGGLYSVKIETVRVDNYHLVGKYFSGSYKSDSIRVYFEEMSAYIKDGTLSGQPVIIYDQEQSDGDGKGTSFIGVMLADHPTSLPASLVKRDIPAQKSIKVTKDAHISVMPNPDKIDQMIQEYALANDLTIAESNIEIYQKNNRLVIERPIVSGAD